ncbi:MAG: heavy metal translocating P-type ATPase [Rhodospirillaceae bacterium]|nr:heavy metal translocating P-type ATPase [Rhodospirillaceae bacterium]
MKKNFPATSQALWGHLLLVLLSLVAIAAHFALRFAALSDLAGIQVADMPLMAVITAGSIPVLWQIGHKLLKLNFGADILAVLALITAAILGEYLAAVLIIVMIASGQALEIYAMRKASSALLALAARMPSIAHLKTDVGIEEIPIGDIRIGHKIVIFPHETCPVDGVVIEGHGSMDESYLTGEPYQVSKVAGTSVLSGSINGESVLVVLAEKLPSDSRYVKIMEVMREAEQKRPALRRLGDQIGAVFVPLALTVASLVWLITGEATRFLAVLVIATPCPLLIAIPITLISAVSMAAKRGIIIKDPTVLERLPTCRTAIFDKTGTLTYGKPELTEIIAAQGIAPNIILQQVASLERYSKHPLADAILRSAEKSKLPLLDATSVSEKPGMGLTGTIDGKEIHVTHRKKLLQVRPEILSIIPPITAGLECIILLNGLYAATFHFRDEPRKDGKSFIGHLAPSHHFTRLMLVSGDRESEVAYLAQYVGITVTMASQSPEQKLAIVRAETAKAPTLYMGDGINDAPALTAATVGIAFGQASDVTAEAAGALILENTLAKVDELLHLGLTMRKIALQSAIGGMLLSILGMGFAAAGYLTPVDGALLQEGIDVLAIMWALRLTWQRKIESEI